MDTLIVVIVSGLALGMLVLMVNYARFIHKYPVDPQNPDQKKPGNIDNPNSVEGDSQEK